MADEDEIDVLGDFNIDNFLSKTDSEIYNTSTLVSQNTEILNCDYTIHPQWLLDKPNANPACWYSATTGSDLSGSLTPEHLELEQNLNNEITTENAISDESGWTEKEKNLLQRGIEIFGKSNVRLSQFIGSKSSSEVKYYLRHFYTDVETTSSTFSNEIILDNDFTDNVQGNSNAEVFSESEIPASIEEVIAVVNTAKPTIKTIKKSPKKQINNTQKGKCFSFNTKATNVALFKKNKSIPHHKLKSHNTDKKLAKFKTKLKLSKPTYKKDKIDGNNFVKKAEIITGKGLSVPVCDGEQVIRIKKTCDDSESDLEIDIEDIDDNLCEDVKTTISDDKPNILMEIQKYNENKTEEVNKTQFDMSNISETVSEQLKSLEVPKNEVVLDENIISDLEKAIHSEFFEDRPTKTPERYLKIRNHIINMWVSSKPIYVTKTSIRNGLKNCGDVNCIGRIHYFLEQIGAINFGCLQTNYFRPLFEMLQTNVMAKEKVKESNKNFQTESIMRPRNKKKFTNDGEGGCTLMHNENGDVINTTVVNEDKVKQRIYAKRPSIKLIYCRPFNDENPQKYSVYLHLSALMLMDLHAHSSVTEVMGLIGGQWDMFNRCLTITHYEPCRNIASSKVHCDMCPISQAKAADTIHNEGLTILGWFHSHPTFAPEPSQQDLDTQLFVQQWIGTSKPCIGFILSPFSLQGALIASPYRCMIVDKKNNFLDQYVPFKLKVEVIYSDLDIEKFLKNAYKLFELHSYINKEDSIDFKKSYFQDQSFSYLDKFISSIKMHLAKCGNVNKMTCDKIIQGLMDICNNI